MVGFHLPEEICTSVPACALGSELTDLLKSRGRGDVIIVKLGLGFI